MTNVYTRVSVFSLYFWRIHYVSCENVLKCSGLDFLNTLIPETIHLPYSLDRNARNRNTRDRNTRNRNTRDRNSLDRNTRDRNSLDRNTRNRRIDVVPGLLNS